MLLVGGFKHVLWFISYIGCHPSHWRTPSFFRGVGQPPTSLCYPGVMRCGQSTMNGWIVFQFRIVPCWSGAVYPRLALSKRGDRDNVSLKCYFWQSDYESEIYSCDLVWLLWQWTRTMKFRFQPCFPCGFWTFLENVMVSFLIRNIVFLIWSRIEPRIALGECYTIVLWQHSWKLVFTVYNLFFWYNPYNVGSPR